MVNSVKRIRSVRKESPVLAEGSVDAENVNESAEDEGRSDKVWSEVESRSKS